MRIAMLYRRAFQERSRGASISRDSGRGRRSGARLPGRQKRPLWKDLTSLFLGAFEGVCHVRICYLRIVHDTLAEVTSSQQKTETSNSGPLREPRNLGCMCDGRHILVVLGRSL